MSQRIHRPVFDPAEQPEQIGLELMLVVPTMMALALLGCLALLLSQ